MTSSFGGLTPSISNIVKEGQSSMGLALIIRARYGSALAKFLKLHKADPSLRSSMTRRGVQHLLHKMLEIMKDCQEDENLDWLLLNGSFHCRSIIDQIYAAGQEWQEVWLVFYFI